MNDGGRLGSHNVAPYLPTDVHERCTGPSAIDFVVPAHPSWASNYLLHSGTLPPEIPSVGSFRGFRLLGRMQWLPDPDSVTPLIRVMLLLRALQHSASPPGQGFHGVPMAVFSALSSSITAINILSN